MVSASVLNHTIVTDPTIRQPGCRLPRHTWSLMNCFQTGQDPYRDHVPHCRQCPLTKFEGGLNLLHEADDDAVI